MLLLILACLISPADELVVLVRRAVDYCPVQSQIGRRITIRLKVHSADDDFTAVQGDGPGESMWTVYFRPGNAVEKDDVVIEGKLTAIRRHAGGWIDGVWVGVWQEYVVEDATEVK